MGNGVNPVGMKTFSLEDAVLTDRDVGPGAGSLVIVDRQLAVCLLNQAAGAAYGLRENANGTVSSCVNQCIGSLAYAYLAGASAPFILVASRVPVVVIGFINKGSCHLGQAATAANRLCDNTNGASARRGDCTRLVDADLLRAVVAGGRCAEFAGDGDICLGIGVIYGGQTTASANALSDNTSCKIARGVDIATAVDSHPPPLAARQKASNTDVALLGVKIIGFEKLLAKVLRRQHGSATATQTLGNDATGKQSGGGNAGVGVYGYRGTMACCLVAADATELEKAQMVGCRSKPAATADALRQDGRSPIAVSGQGLIVMGHLDGSAVAAIAAVSTERELHGLQMVERETCAGIVYRCF